MPTLLRRIRRRARGDGGFTLVEYAISMAIFAVVISITISGVVLMTRDAVKTTNLAASTDQIRQAFTRLDRQVRYADEINRPGPGTTASRIYVEFRALNSSGVATCYQWRVDTATRELQYRQWPANPAPSTITASFAQLAPHIANTTSQAPFTFVAASDKEPFQGLEVMLIGKRASTNTAAVTLRTSLTARNSSVASDSNADTDKDGDSDVPVCTTSSGVLSRP